MSKSTGSPPAGSGTALVFAAGARAANCSFPAGVCPQIKRARSRRDTETPVVGGVQDRTNAQRRSLRLCAGESNECARMRQRKLPRALSKEEVNNLSSWESRSL